MPYCLTVYLLVDAIGAKHDMNMSFNLLPLLYSCLLTPLLVDATGAKHDTGTGTDDAHTLYALRRGRGRDLYTH
jgi:hypothetical protein